MLGQNESRTGRKISFVVIVIAAGILAATAFFFVARYVVEYIQEYMKYASLKGTGIILERDGISGLMEWIGEEE